MTIEQLQEILALPAPDAIKELEKTSFANIPSWSELEPQYDPTQHSILNTALYPPKLDAQGKDDFKRTSYGLQKLAVNRLAQAMFATPVTRTYNLDRESESEQKAAKIIEEIYRVQNTIDGSNIQRAKKLNACCEIVTVWRAYEILGDNLVEGESTKYKLKHKTYSAIDGYEIYPITDGNGDLLVVTIAYTDSEELEHREVYTNGETAAYYHFFKEDDWVLDEENSNNDLTVFPVVHAYLEEPVWGGDHGTSLVTQLEEMESNDGFYLKRNSLPTFTLDYGKIAPGSKLSSSVESSLNSRNIIKVGEGGKMNDVTWKGAGEALQRRFDRIRNAFFEENQIPDTSFSNMIASNTSADNKELIFGDAKARARDLGSVWEKLFYEELKIIASMAAVMFPGYSEAFSKMSVRTQVQPYAIRTRKENAEYVSIAGDSMSLETKVKVIGEADDHEAEVEAIREQNAANANQGIL